MRLRRAILPTFALLVTVSCTNKTATTASTPTDGPHAKVTLKDGSFLLGKVLESTPSQITLAGDDNQNHTVATSQVRSLEYEDAAAPPLASAPPPAETAPPAPAPAAPQPAPQAKSRPVPTEERAFGSTEDHPQHYHPAEEAVRSRSLLVPSGTSVPVRTEETIDSGKAVEGQTFAGEITKDILDREGSVVIPRGSNAQIVIRSAAKGGRFHGQSDLVLDLESLSVGGRRYQVSTTDIVEKGKNGVGGNKRTAVFAGGGSAFGAIIGAIAGGGKGAAIGALSGAGAGAATQVLTKGGAIRVPVESVLSFRLDRPLRIQFAR